MKFKLIFSVFTLIVTASLMAFGKIKSVTFDAQTASNVIQSESTINVYGGLVTTGSSPSEAEACTGPSDATCDSCAGLTSWSPLKACNKKSIHSELRLRVVVEYSELPSGTLGYLVKTKSVTEGNGVVLVQGENNDYTVSPETPKANEPIVFLIKWDSICSAFTGGKKCKDLVPSGSLKTISISDNLFLGLRSGSASVFVDEQAQGTVFVRKIQGDVISSLTSCPEGGATAATVGQGVCNFQMAPGDKKALVSLVYMPATTAGGKSVNLSISDSTTGTSLIKYKAFRVFYTPSGVPYNAPLTTAVMESKLPPNSVYTDVGLTERDSAVFIERSLITGLENNVEYIFGGATVDQAENVTYPFVAANLNPEAHTANPGDVNGLLTGKSCYVATVAYHSSNHQAVQLLRSFRDEVLLKHFVGRAFTQIYYKFSPELAELVSKSPVALAVSQVVLTPTVAWASWIMQQTSGSRWVFVVGSILIFFSALFFMTRFFWLLSKNITVSNNDKNSGKIL